MPPPAFASCVATPNSALGAMGVRTRDAWSTNRESRWSVLWLDDDASDPDLRQRQLMRKRFETIALRAPDAEHQLQARGRGEAGLRCVPERRAPGRRVQLEPHAEMREPKT